LFPRSAASAHSDDACRWLGVAFAFSSRLD
jgi:hypothetical protein